MISLKFVRVTRLRFYKLSFTIHKSNFRTPVPLLNELAPAPQMMQPFEIQWSLDHISVQQNHPVTPGSLRKLYYTRDKSDRGKIRERAQNGVERKKEMNLMHHFLRRLQCLSKSPVLWSNVEQKLSRTFFVFHEYLKLYIWKILKLLINRCKIVQIILP